MIPLKLFLFLLENAYVCCLERDTHITENPKENGPPSGEKKECEKRTKRSKKMSSKKERSKMMALEDSVYGH